FPCSSIPAIAFHGVILRHPPPSGCELWLNSPDLDAFSLFHQLPDTTKMKWDSGKSLITCELRTRYLEDRKLELNTVLYMGVPEPLRKLGRAIYKRIEKAPQPKKEYLFLRSRNIHVPPEFDDNFNEAVAEEIASYIRSDLPQITAEIKEAVKGITASI
ncbi:MAG TPA: hypothetical protein VKS22_03790, partial [Candidatus Binataceae bacterium]|nr:hypothetical protein [Candidatus Binataceae bacterium]